MCKVVDCLFFKKRNFFLRAGRPSEKGYFTFFLFIFLTNFFQGLSILRNCFKGHVGLEIFVPREFVSKVIKGISDPQNNFFRVFNTFLKGFDPRKNPTLL